VLAGEPIGAAAGLGLPALFAKLVTSDFGRKLLTEGYRISPGSQEAIKFAGRLSAFLASKN